MSISCTTAFDSSLVCCSVAGCNSVKIYGIKDVLKFHKFPKNVEYGKEWMKRCCRNELWEKEYTILNSNYRICSLHFKLSDYAGEKFLKKDAVPSQNLPNEYFASEGMTLLFFL